MSETGIDIAWDRPTIPQIKATGAKWVARYFSTDPSKNLTAAEVRDYHAAGLGIVTVWETTTARATQGYQAGIDDAGLAEGQRKAVGLPGDMVIHFAVDEDTDWASVEPYFRGASAVLGQQRVGLYGGFRPVEGAHGAGYRYLWQTTAWSGGRWSAHATIRQPGGMTLHGAADYDTAETPDFGQYPRPTSEVDMDATQAKQLQELHDALVPYKGYDYRNQAEDVASMKATGKHSPDAWGKLSAVLSGQAQVAAQLGALSAAVAALAKGGGLTAEQVQAAAKAGADEALAQAEAAAKRVVDALQPPAPTKP